MVFQSQWDLLGFTRPLITKISDTKTLPCNQPCVGLHSPLWMHQELCPMASEMDFLSQEEEISVQNLDRDLCVWLAAHIKQKQCEDATAQVDLSSRANYSAHQAGNQCPWSLSCAQRLPSPSRTHQREWKAHWDIIEDWRNSRSKHRYRPFKDAAPTKKVGPVWYGPALIFRHSNLFTFFANRNFRNNSQNVTSLLNNSSTPSVESLI